MSANFAALSYLISGILFILCLRGLSHPTTARNGNFLGMAGMILAVLTTLALMDLSAGTIAFVIVGLGLGGGIGYLIASRISMTKVPQLVAGFHSLVGMAAVVVGMAAYYSPEAFNIGTAADIQSAALIEMALGVAVGAITFSGSVIAFAKLDGRMKGAPIVLPYHHYINAALALVIVLLTVLFTVTEASILLWIIALLSFVLGVTLIIPIGGADMPVVVSMLNSYSGWAAAAVGFTLQNTALIITGALVGSSGAILSYIMCKAMNRSFISVIAGGFGAEASTSSDSEEEAKPVKKGSADDAEC